MLIDRHMPDADVSRTRHAIVDAYPEETFEALGTARIDDPLLRTLFHVSRLPARIRWRLRGREPSPDPRNPTLKEVSWRERMPLLDERAGDELVSGIVLRTRGAPGKRVRDIAASDFSSYQEPGHAKIAASMSVRPYGPGRTLLVQDVRAKGTDPRTTAWLQRSARVTRSIQDLLMDRTLQEVRDEAERPQPPPGRPPTAAADARRASSRQEPPERRR